MSKLDDLRKEVAEISRNWSSSPHKETASTEIDDIFSPRTFEEYLGQSQAKEIASIVVDAAKKEQRPLPNLLIAGEWGTGKSTLARLVVTRFGEPVRIFDGASVNYTIPDGTFIVDEIHNLDSATADALNILIDQNKVHIIGATTNPGKLPAAFRSRFRTITLDAYTRSELAEILRRIIVRKGVNARADILREIATRSRYNARVAISYLQFMFDILTLKNQKILLKPIVNEAFNKLGVDESGFITNTDYRYLAALPSDGRPVGLQYLSAKLGIDIETIESEIEPYLLRTGMIDRQPRGRVKLKEIVIE